MNRVEPITSRANPKIQQAAKLKDKRQREKLGEFAFEGKKLFLEALERQVPLSAVFCTEAMTAFCQEAMQEAGAASVPLYAVSESVYEKLSEEKSPEGIFCTAKTIDKRHKIATIYMCEKSESEKKPFRAILSQLRDPGNLGTVIRTAAAFGIEELILSQDCADIYNRKTVRAAMGTLFSMKITVVYDLTASIAILQKNGCRVLGAALDRRAKKLTELSAKELGSGRIIFAVGNEGHGLSPEILSACDGSVFIPMTDQAESLNAAIASSLLFWELYRVGETALGDRL